MAKLGDTLIYLRKRAGLTQQELADVLQISKSTVGMYETNKREPDLETLEVIADYFNVDMNFLTGCERKNMPATENDDELNVYLEELRNRSEMRMLFKLAQGATKEEVEQAVKVIEALRK